MWLHWWKEFENIGGRCGNAHWWQRLCCNRVKPRCSYQTFPSREAAQPLLEGPAVARELLGKEDGRMGPRRKRGARVGFLLPHTVRKTSLEETSPSPRPAASPTDPTHTGDRLEPRPVSPRLIRRQDQKYQINTKGTCFDLKSCIAQSRAASILSPCKNFSLV